MFSVQEDLLLQQEVPGGTLEENADPDQGGCTLYRQAMQKVVDSKCDAPSLWCLICLSLEMHWRMSNQLE